MAKPMEALSCMGRITSSPLPSSSNPVRFHVQPKEVFVSKHTMSSRRHKPSLKWLVSFLNVLQLAGTQVAVICPSPCCRETSTYSALEGTEPFRPVAPASLPLVHREHMDPNSLVRSHFSQSAGWNKTHYLNWRRSTFARRSCFIEITVWQKQWIDPSALKVMWVSKNYQ